MTTEISHSPKHNMMKTSLLLILIIMLIGSILCIPVLAKDTVIANLLPSNDSERGNLTLTGCTLEENSDGSVTFTLTKKSASFKMVFAESFYAEGKGGTIFNDEPIDLSKPAFMVYDYASADGVTLGDVIAHYTRKDKAPANTLADLYLISMEDQKFGQYSKAKGVGFGVWDWGTYVSSVDTKRFDDNIHRFVDFEGSLAGNIGSKITIYSFYVSSTFDVKDLGKVRPEPTLEEIKEESSSVSKESIEESNTSDNESSQLENSKEDSNVSSEAESSIVSNESNNSEASDDDKSDDNNTLIYIIAIAGGLIVIGGIAYLLMKKKK